MRSFCRIAILLPPLLLSAQQPAASDEVRVSSQPYSPRASYKFRAETRLVDVGAAVRDAHGHAVSGLTRDNFHIYEDGKKREIATFSESRAGAGGLAAKAAAAAPENAAAGETTLAPGQGTGGRTRFLVFFSTI